MSDRYNGGHAPASTTKLVWRRSGERRTLHLGSNSKVLAFVVPDIASANLPTLYRIGRPGAELSDLVNISRATDAAIDWAMATLREMQGADSPVNTHPCVRMSGVAA